MSSLDDASTPARRFRATLDGLPAAARDAWVDQHLGIDPPDDDDDLPRGCVPYLPCAVDHLLRAIDLADIRADDVFVDVGSGIGRATAIVHRATSADAIGIEIQARLVRAARRLADALSAPRVTTLHGDALDVLPRVGHGTVFFLYCPFSGDRLDRVLDHLEAIAREHAIRVCTVDMPVIERPWLHLTSPREASLLVYRSAIA